MKKYTKTKTDKVWFSRLVRYPYRSFRRRVFPVNHLHWYWQPNTNNQATEHTNNI